MATICYYSNFKHFVKINNNFFIIIQTRRKLNNFFMTLKNFFRVLFLCLNNDMLKVRNSNIKKLY